MNADEALAIMREHLVTNEYRILPPTVGPAVRDRLTTLLSRGVVERDALTDDDPRRSTGNRFVYRIAEEVVRAGS